MFGGYFADENFDRKHDRPYLLSMANRGKNTNGSQFFVTTQPAPHLDNLHVFFGEVISGQEVIKKVEHQPTNEKSRPYNPCTVSNCGELVLVKKTKKITADDLTSSSGKIQFVKKQFFFSNRRQFDLMPFLGRSFSVKKNL